MKKTENVRKILFVCTGNTCRSPMAAALFNAVKPPKDRRPAVTWHAESAGLAALAGAPPTAEAVEVLRELGLDHTDHRARSIDPALLAAADLVVTMTEAQRDHLRRLAPDAAEHIRSLAEASGLPGDVDDPFGGDVDRYRETRKQLSSRIIALWDKLHGLTS